MFAMYADRALGDLVGENSERQHGDGARTTREVDLPTVDGERRTTRREQDPGETRRTGDGDLRPGKDVPRSGERREWNC